MNFRLKGHGTFNPKCCRLRFKRFQAIRGDNVGALIIKIRFLGPILIILAPPGPTDPHPSPAAPLYWAWYLRDETTLLPVVANLHPGTLVRSPAPKDCWFGTQRAKVGGVDGHPEASAVEAVQNDDTLFLSQESLATDYKTGHRSTKNSKLLGLEISGKGG